ncbi:MAG: RluA family pseudouridine synthase [Clostridia bacterium]
MERIFRLEIPVDMSGKTIKQILNFHYHMSSRLISKLKLTQGISLNNRKVTVNAVVQEKDILMLVAPAETSENIVPTYMDLDIQYEDEDIMIVNKPSNMPVHPSQGNFSNTLANGIVYYWQQKGTNFVYRPVNRLDKDTSGLMIIAKNQYAHQQLANQIIDKELKRKYIALVHGDMQDEKGMIDLPIAREEGSIIKRIVDERGKQAITHYKVLQKIRDFTMVELMLQTGRTHQIRVHMSHIGHPLVGDWLYGREEPELISRQALHSCYLGFVHPVSKQEMKFTSNIPEDIKRLIDR